MRLPTRLDLVFLFLYILIPSANPADVWVPYTLDWKQPPVDLSYLLDAPSGKHGYLGVKGDTFVFEDGTRFRAWGITMRGQACFPPQDLSPVLADAFARHGFNLVRFSDLQLLWKTEPNTLPSLDAALADRLDYFLYQLETRGVYASFSASFGGEDPSSSGDIHVDTDQREEYKRFLEMLWTHRSRYSGRQYRDTPAIVMMQLFNDQPLQRLSSQGNGFLATHWEEWLRQKGLPFASALDLRNPDEENKRFLSEVLSVSQERLKAHLRSISVKAAVSGNNTFSNLLDLPSLQLMDYVPVRAVWDEPLGKPMMHNNRRLSAIHLQDEPSLFAETAFARLINKPLLVSGWAQPYPSRYRAELPLWMAAMACFQDWQGATLENGFTSLDAMEQTALNPNDAFNDPCLFGLIPAASLLFHESHVAPAKESAVMKPDKKAFFTNDPITPMTAKPTRLVDGRKVVVDLTNRISGANVYLPTQPEEIAAVITANPRSGLRRDSEKAMVLIDTPKTQAVIGTLSNAGQVSAAKFRVQSEEPFGVICAGSLDGKPTEESGKLLITLISEAKNTGFSARGDEGVVLVEQPGDYPVLIKETPCRVYLKTSHTNWTIEPLKTGGAPQPPVPYQIQDGWLSFQAGTHGTIYYRLTLATE